MSEYSDGSIIIDTELNTKGFEADSAELKRAVKSLSTKLEGLGPTLQKVFSGNAAAVSSFTAKAALLENQIADVQSRMETLGDRRLPTQDYQDFIDKADKAGRELEALYEKEKKLESLGVKKTSTQWKTLQYDIKQAGERMEQYNAMVNQMESDGTAFRMGSDTEEYKQLEAQLTAIKQKYADMQAESEKAVSQMSETQTANAKTEALKESYKKLGNVIAGIGKKAASAFGAMAKYIGGGRAAIAKLNRSGADTNKTIGKLRKSMTGFMGLLKRLALRKLISGILSAMKSGMQNLAKYSSSFNADLSELLTLFNQVKNTLATVFAPILSIAMPILTTLIGAFQSAAEKAAEFFAALSGSSTFTKAIKKYKDYAESLQKSVTASFDQLNTLSDDDDDDASTLFETADVSSGVADFIAKLKEAFSSGDLSFVGELLANKLNGVLSSAKEFLSDTSKIQTGIQAVISAFNSLIGNVDWELAGNVVGGFIQAIVDSLHTLYSAVDWATLGASFANGLNGIIESVEWSAVGSLLAERFMSIISFLGNAVATFNWALLGNALADGVNGVFTAIDWDGIWTFISDTITGIGNGIIGLIENIDWGAVGKSISGCVAGFVSACVALVQNIDWVDLFMSIGSAIESIFENIDWSAIVAGLSELSGSLVALLVKLLWEGLKKQINSTVEMFTDLFNWLGNLTWEGFLQGIVDAVKGIGTWIYNNIFKPFIDGFKSIFGIHSPSTVMAELGGYLIEGLLSGIKNLWSTITDFFGNALEGIKNLFTNAWNAIKEITTTVWNGIKSGLSAAWDGIKSAASTVWNGISATISNTWNNIKSFTSTTWNNISSTLSSVWGNIKSAASTVWSGLTSTISNAWNNVKSFTSTAWNGISATVSSAWSNIKSATSSTWNSISSTLSSVWGKIKSTASSAWSGISTTITDVWGNLKTNATTWGKDLVTNMANGIKNAVNTVKDAVSSVASKIRSWLGFSEPEEGPLSDFHTFMPDMLDLMAEGIEDNENVPLEAISDIAQAIKDEFQNDEYALGTVGVTSALDRSLDIFADKVESHFNSLIERLKAIAKGVTFAVPVAANAAVPHGFAGGNPNGSGGFSAHFTRLTELMEKIMEKLDNVTGGLDGAKKAIVEAIDEKETGITSEAIYGTVKSAAKKETKATGRNPFGG